MKLLYICLLLIVIVIICSMKSYKIETFDIPGTYVDNNINATLDTYNCYDYISKKYPSWTFDDHQLKALNTMKTGIDTTYQIDGDEPQYTHSCIIPVEHGFLYKANNQPILSITSSNMSTHQLPLNSSAGPDTPHGYVIDFSEPNILSGINYSEQGNFNDLLTSAYYVMDSNNLNIIQTLSNTLYADSMVGPSSEIEKGLIKLNQSYNDMEDADTIILNNSINEYKPMCMMKKSITSPEDVFMKVCADDNAKIDNTNLCCPSKSYCTILQNKITAVNATNNMNKTNIGIMKSTIDYINKNLPIIKNIVNTPVVQATGRTYQYNDFLQSTIGDSDMANQPIMGKLSDCENACDSTGCVGFSREKSVDDGQIGQCFLKKNISPGGLGYSTNDPVWRTRVPIVPTASTAIKAKATNNVTFYTECGYKGQSVSMGPGSYNMDKIVIPNDSLNSVSIPPGRSVILYQDMDFNNYQIRTNDQIVLTKDTPCLKTQKWDNRASSWKIQ